MSPRRATLGGIELEVLKVLWERPSATVREVLDALRLRGRDLEYTTVQTHLTRLAGKGFVASDKTGLAHVYHAAVSRERLLQDRLADLADQLCEGTASPLLLALVEGGRFTPADLEQFRKLLDQLDRPPDPPKSGKR